MQAVKTRHVSSNTGAQWAITGIVYLFFFIFFIWYHDVRGKPFSLLTTEKCTAIASVYCFALALALGPLSRFWPSMESLLPYRRTLGLIAAFASIPHVILALAYLPVKYPEEYSTHYPFSWFVAHWLAVVSGLIGFALLLLIAAHSYPAGVHKLGRRRWMILQKIAYLAMILVALHLLSTGKIPRNWIAWIETRDKSLPPGSFPTMVVCAGALILKAVDLIVHGDSLAWGTNERSETLD